MSDVTNKPALRVVRGKEDALLRKEHRDGYVYFATDTGKIYMDTASEEKILMGGGGNSGIYYAQKKFTEATDTTFSIDDIITNELPSENDLIINTSAEIGGDIERDGFYQVLQVVELENKVIAKQLPVGGGGGGIGPGGTMGFASIDYIVPKDGVASTLISEDYWIEYKLTAEDSAGDTVPNSGTATWIINGKTIDGGQIYPGTNKFNVTKYLDSRLDVNNVKLSVAIMTGSASPTIVSKTWQITAIDLKLEWDYTYSADSYVDKDTFTVSFIPWGNVACKAYLLFDNNENYRYFLDIPASKTGKTNYFTLDSLPYGTHRGQMWLTATINGKDYRTSTITHELTFVYDGNGPIITTPFSQVSATQYDTIRIPFLIYNPETTETAMRVLVNDVEVSTPKNYNRDLHNFDYTIGLSGTVKIKLEHDTNNYREFELSVTPLELDVEEPKTPTYKLKADTIVDNAALQALPGLTFSDNFDWQNGGMQSETSEDGVITKYICIKNGTTMTIDYNLFGNDATQYGKNFKFIFKATKCYDYDAQVLECFDSVKGVGINVTAQKATFNSGSIELKADYCENSYIELEMEVWPKHNIDQYMMMWIDGIPSNVRIYESDTFQQSNGNIKPITIGSNDCDVYVYLVKIYERMLNEEEHLENFIMDAPNTQEKIARYKRNDILDNSGEISYQKLVKNNPNCHAYLYDIPYMTIDKNTKVPCQYTEYCNDSETPIITANDALMFVQGTSSAAYGIAAFNLRTDFRDTTMYNGKGEEIAGKEVSETAIPIDYACTKVNVASCENANNVVNAEWYNRFQPYHDAHRRKVRADGKKYRDCMEFDFGVVFVRDHNQETSYRGSDGKPSEGAYLAANVFADTPNYTKSPYYKQYAVGNMGNDKKNVEVFHDTENPLACCVEVANNQTAKQFMTEKITVADLGDKVTENYEFRYPDGNKKASTAMKEGWVRFVNWMADSNPAAADSTKILQAVPVDFSKEPFVKNKFYVLNNEGKYIKSFEDYNESTTYYNIIAKKPTGSEQLIEVLFDSYTFKGFDPPGYEG